MSEKEKATREYLETLSKEQVIDLCLQYINDKNIAEQQLEALMLEISKQEVEQHDLPDYCTRTGTDCTYLGKAEELEKVKKEMDLNGNSYCEIRQGTSPHNPTDYAWFNYVKFRNYLNQQIKELKGE